MLQHSNNSITIIYKKILLRSSEKKKWAGNGDQKKIHNLPLLTSNPVKRKKRFHKDHLSLFENTGVNKKAKVYIIASYSGKRKTKYLR